jgi:phosphatidylethanolamine-binding protein (PEBP) family uncharacterized protein
MTAKAPWTVKGFIPERINCDDPDAPIDTWVHWVLFNLPPDINELHVEIAP